MGSGKAMQNKRSSRKLTLEDPKDILTVIHKMELFTPPPAMDGNDFSGNILELMDAGDPTETAACFVKMERNLERVEFHSVGDKKSWITDVQKAAKNCFETWKKDYFKSMVEARMSQRSVTAPQPTQNTSPLPSNSSLASNHARSTSLGDVRVNAAVAALEKNNGPVNDKVVRKSPRGSHHPPVPLAWITGRVSPLNTFSSEITPEHPPSPKSILKSNSSSTVSFSTPEPHPSYISPQNRQLPSFKTCPDLFNPLPRNTSEQNWEVESEEMALRESRGSSTTGDDSGRDSALMSSVGSIGSSTELSQPANISSSSEHPRARRMTVGSPSDVEFWEEVRRGNEAAKDLEKELERVGVTPRGGSLVRSQRKNFAMTFTAEEKKALNGKGPASSLNTIDELMSLHKHELAKKDEELAKKREEMAEELKKKDEEISKLKSQVTDEVMRTRIFRDKFQDMQKLYHEADMRDKAKPQDAADHLRLNEELADLKKKLTDERDGRRFYRDKFQDMQRLYQDSLTSIMEFQEQVKKLGTNDKDGDAKWEQRLEEERLRKQFFKDKFQEMNRLYQESLESVTTFVEKSREAEKLYRATLEEANNNKRRTQELEGLYFETQESVEFFREKVHTVEEACRESMREAEYFRLKAEKMEKGLMEAQKSVSLYQSNMDAMSSMLREAQNECIFYKQKSHEQEIRKSKEVQAIKSHDNVASNGDSHASEMAELQQLYREAQASAQRYRELAEERVKRLEATVEKYKSSAPTPQQTIVHAPPKLIRTKSQINTPRLKDRRKSQRPGLRRSRGESIVIKESDIDSEQSTQESETLPHTEEDENAWMEFAKENQLSISVNYQPTSSPQQQTSSGPNSPEPLSSSSSQASPNIAVSPLSSSSGGEEEFEIVEIGSKSSDRRSSHKPHRGSGSKLRAQKLQKQIQQRLIQKSLKQSS